MILPLLLASLSFAQEKSTAPVYGMTERLKVQNISMDVRELQEGRPIITGLPRYQNGIMFGDGTTQTTAASGSAFSVDSDSWSMTSGSFAFPTDQFACATGSTITFTVSNANNNVEINLDVEAINNTGGATALIGILQDGATVFHASENTQSSGGYATKQGWYWRKKLSAGSHTFCVFGYYASGVFTLYGQSLGRESGYFIREVTETTP